jgi:putative membrane protein
MKKHIPLILLILYIILFIICAINPFDRAVRRAENIPVMITVALLVFTYKKFQFSTTAYIVMSLWIYMHTIGGHYTFEHVPFDWFNNFFGFERNMYDRIAHYIIWFYAYPLIEYLDRKQLVNKSWVLYSFAIFAIFTLAGVYEIIERWYAASFGGEQWVAFLGSQGDIRDAQKDILADGLGAITMAVMYRIQKRVS